MQDSTDAEFSVEIVVWAILHNVGHIMGALRAF